MSLARLMKAGMFFTSPISVSIFSAASLAPPWAGPHRQAMPAAMQANGLAPEEPDETHRVGRCVLLVVGVQDEDLVERAREHRIDLVLLARHRKAHPHEVRGVVEIVLRIDERLADRVLVGHRRQRRHLGDHAHRGDHALVRIVDVGGVVIERRTSRRPRPPSPPSDARRGGSPGRSGPSARAPSCAW